MTPIGLCAICANPGVTRGSFTVGSQELKLQYCVACNLYFLSPPLALSRDDQAKYYDEQPEGWCVDMAEHFDDAAKYVPLKESYRDQLAYFERFVPKGKLLDVGCAFGGFGYIALAEGWDVTGVEISPYWANRAQTLWRNQGRVVEGKLEEVALPDGEYSLIHLRHVIEHLDDPHVVLAAMYRLLAPGGIIAIETPNNDALINSVYHAVATIKRSANRYLSPVNPPFHLLGFSLQSLDAILTQNGFRKVRARTTAHGDPVWRLRVAEIPVEEFYGRPLWFTVPAYRTSAALGRGDNLLALYTKA